MKFTGNDLIDKHSELPRPSLGVEVMASWEECIVAL